MRKITALLMLAIMSAQIFMPTMSSAVLLASEVQSSTAESEVASQTDSETTSEVSAEAETVSSEQVSEQTSETEIDSETTEEVEVNESSKALREEVIEIEVSPEDVYEGDNVTGNLQVTVNPNDAENGLLSEGEQWDSVTLTFPPQFDLNESYGIEINQDDPGILSVASTEVDGDGNTVITFDVDKAALEVGGQTIDITFIASVSGGVDLGKYGITAEICGDNGTCYDSESSVTYHDPSTFEINKEMVSPTYAAPGEELTYEITATIGGTAELADGDIPQIIDNLPEGSTYVSSTPEGILDGDTVTWDFTDEDIANRSKTVQITIIPNEEDYEVGETFTNTADILDEGKVQDSDEDTEDLYSDFFIDLPDGGINKSGDPTTNPDGNTTAPGDEIFWNFDNINYEGRGHLEDYSLTDTFPTDSEGNDILEIKDLCYGTANGENAIENITINYLDGSSEVLTVDMDSNEDGCINIPDEASIETDNVESVVWFYGDIDLPFTVTGAGIDTTIKDDVPEGTKIDNNLDADFTIPSDNVDGNIDICPPPYLPYENEDGSVECRDEDTGTITTTADEVYGIFTKDIISNTSDIRTGDDVEYQLTIGNAAKSPSSLYVDGIYDMLPVGVEYVPGSLKVDGSLPDTYVSGLDAATNEVNLSFIEDDNTALEVKPGESYTIKYKVKVTSENVESLTNNAYLVSPHPDLLLNGTGTTSMTEPVDLDGDGTLETVFNDSQTINVNHVKITVDKQIDNASKEFVPPNIPDGQSTVDYSIALTNEDLKLLGTSTGSVENPSLVDDMPKELAIDESSISFDFSNAPSITDGSFTVSGDGTSSPIDGEGQSVRFDFTGTLNPGEKIVINYSADVKEYAAAAILENDVSFVHDAGSEADKFTNDSVFTDDAVGLISEIAAQSVNKEVDPDEAQPGQLIKYTVNVKNTGTMPFTNVTFTDDIPQAGIDGTTVSTMISNLPVVYYIDTDGNQREVMLSYNVKYTDNAGNEQEQTLNRDEFEQFVVESGVDTITELSAIVDETLYPGQEAKFVFQVSTPMTGEGAAVAGDKIENTAHFTSTPITMDGKEDNRLSNDTNSVTTTIVAPDEDTYTIGDFVYYDLDGSGTYDPSFEMPVKGALLELVDSDGNVIGETSTDENGNYYFTGVPAGDYVVRKSDAYLSNLYRVEPDLKQNVTIVDEDNLDIDFRVIPASIVGTVYYDGYDSDPTDDSYYDQDFDTTNEQPLVDYDTDVEESLVTLYDSSGAVVATTTTENGTYAFGDLTADDYTVETTPLITATDGQKYVLTNDSDTTEVPLEKGDHVSGVDFGYIEPVTVSGTIWYDVNTNEVYDTDENTSSEYDENRGLKVVLLDKDGNEVKTITSDSTDGSYSFDELLPGNYDVKVVYSDESPNPIHGLENITDSQFTENSSSTSAKTTDNIIASTPNEEYGDNNFGIYQNATIEGNIYEDINYNGTNADSNPAEGRIVNLVSTDGTVNVTVTTDSNGNYLFEEVDPKLDYKIVMSGVDDDILIDSSLTTDTVIDGSGNAIIDSGTEFEVNPNDYFEDIDGSVYRQGTVKSLAFVDMDGDGLQDFSGLDQYLENVSINLKGQNGMGDDVDLTLTSISGDRISFEDIDPGNYTVTFTLPVGYDVTWQDKGDDNIDSDIDRTLGTKDITLTSDGEIIVDGGFYEPIDLSGYVFTDMNRDGDFEVSDDDIASNNYEVNIYYYGKLFDTVTTDSNGKFEFNDQAPGDYYVQVALPDGTYEYTILGTDESKITNDNQTGKTDKVQILSGEENSSDFDTGYNQKTSISGKIYLDTNKDLTHQNSELLIDGLKVDLYDADGNVVASTVTDENGFYQFTDLDPGDYYVVAEDPAYADYLNEDEDPSIQSDAKTDQFTALSNTPVENVDGALSINDDTTHYLISDYVWEDNNYNGFQDAGEKPLSGVKVSLLDSSGNPLTYSDSYPGLGISSGDAVTTTTDSNGNYLLIVEGAGDYQVKIETTDDYYLTQTKVGSDDTIDSDFTSNKDNTSTGTYDITVDKDTRDVDGGYSARGSISGYVYDDHNTDYMYEQSDDEPIENGQVGLYLASDLSTPIEVVETDSNGYYQFTDLESGDYVVRFETLADHNAFYTHEADGKLALENGGQDAYRNVSLSYGQDKTDENAGRSEQARLSGITFEDMNADGVYDTSEDITLSGVTAKLYNADGTAAYDEEGNVIEMVTDSSGQYYFKNIVPGDYYVQFTIPNGYTPTNIVPAKADSTSDNDATLESGNLITQTFHVSENGAYITNSDAAYYKANMISGYVYEDGDIDGSFDSSIDSLISGNTVTLVASDGTEQTATTNGDGYYEFTDLKPDTYYVKIDTSSYDHVSGLGSVDTKYDNDIDSAGKSPEITLSSGETNTVSQDGALYNDATLSGYIYEDGNNDGLFGFDEEGLNKVEVSLYDEAGKVVATTSTNGDGYYEFTNVTPGNYYVTVNKLDETYYVANKGDNDLGIASELNGDLTIDSQYLQSSENDDIDFDGGFYRLTSISGNIFFDPNGNLELDKGLDEFGIESVEMTLYDTDGNVVATTNTDSNGDYKFEDVIPGDYYVVAGDASPYGDYEDMAEDYQIKADGQTPIFTAVSNTEKTDVDGAVNLGDDVYLIGDYIWVDKDYDGVQDAIEAGYPDAKISAINSSGDVVATATSDATGYYQMFVPAGDYTFEVTAGSDYHFTKEVSLHDKIDSNVIETDSNVGQTDVTTISKNRTDIDAGVRANGTISGKVYYDTLANGDFEDGVDYSDEPREVSLFKKGLVTDTLIGTQTIDLTDNGSFEFTGLNEGDYYLTYSDEEDRFWVQNVDGGLDFNNKVEGEATRDVALNYGEVKVNQDAGYSNGARISGYIYEDADQDGSYSRELTTPTNVDTPLEGIEVELLDKNQNVLATTTTDSEGYYSFINLEPYLDYSTTIVNVDEDSDGHNDYTSSKMGTSNTAYDNDMSGTDQNIKTGYHTLTDAMYDDVNYDGALLKETDMSGYVYNDLEVNSTMDATDIPLDGIEVKLKTKLGLTTQTTTTDSDGYFEFTNVKPGEYHLVYDLDGYEVSPRGKVNTALDNDMNDNYKTDNTVVVSSQDDDVSYDAAVYQLVSLGGTVFEDMNADGVQELDEAGLSGKTVELYGGDDNLIDTVTTNSDGEYQFTDLMPGEYYVKVDTTDYNISPVVSSKDKLDNDLNASGSTDSQIIYSSNSNYEDYDAGLYQLTSISGKIYLDTNANLNREETEFLIPNQTITLTDDAGNVVATTVTDENGYYEFLDLTPGNYIVTVEQNPYASYENEDEQVSIQSDRSTGQFTALSNTPVVNVDGALTIAGDDHHFIISDYAWEDSNYNGIQDDGEKPLSGVEVSLLDSDGNPLTYQSDYPGFGITAGDEVKTTTNSDGLYVLIAETGGSHIVKAESSNDYYVTDAKVTGDTLDNDFTKTKESNVGTYNLDIVKDTRDVDSGFVKQGIISGNVYDDENMDFSYNSGDIEVEGSVVELYLQSDLETPIATTTTDENGYYEFTDLKPGKYVVRFEHLASLDAFWTPEADGSLFLENNASDSYRQVTLDYDETKANENAGRSDQTLVLGITFEDINNDGVFTVGTDKLLSDVDARLMNSDGTPATNSEGNDITAVSNRGIYYFIGVLPGDYYVEFDTPEGYYPTNVVVEGSTTNSNNDAIQSEDGLKTEVFNVEENHGYLTYSDSGYYQTTNISGYYYEDGNADGSYDSRQDTLLTGYNVQLLDEEGNVVKQTKTNRDGYYEFTEVVPANYQIKFDVTDYDNVSVLGTPETEYDNDVTAEDGTTELKAYNSGETYTTEQDGAVYDNAKLSGYAYEDSNNDGLFEQASEEGLSTTVQLLDEEGNVVAETTTDSDGYYEFTDLVPNNYYVNIATPSEEYSIANKGDNSKGIGSELNEDNTTLVQVLSSGETDNRNFDGGFYRLTSISGQIFFDSNASLELDESINEFGIPNVEVTLLDSEGNVVATRTTDENGEYRFEDVVPGNYTVTASDSDKYGDYENMPEDYQIKDDSKTPEFTAYSNVERDNVDGAITQGEDMYLLGDYVWDDINYNGLQDSDEAGYAGATIRALDSDGNVITSAITDSDGMYFMFVPKGDITLEVTVNDSYRFTKNLSRNILNDSNIIETDSNVGTVDLTISENDLSVDAGIIQNVPTVIEKSVTEGTPDGYANNDEVLYYTINITNEDELRSSFNVDVRDSMLENLPDYITYNDDMVVDGSDYDGDLSTSDLQLTEVKPGKTVTVTYSVTLTDDLVGSGVDSIENVVTDNGEDPDGLCDSTTSTDDCDGTETPVQPEIVTPIDPEQGQTVITKEVTEEYEDGYASPKETLYYTITLNNPTTSDAHNVEVRDSMLENLPEYVTYNDDMVVDGSEYSGDLSTSDLKVFEVAAGKAVVVTYSITLSEDLLDKDVDEIVNVATDNGENPEGACDSETSTDDCDGTEIEVQPEIVLPIDPEQGTTVITKEVTEEYADNYASPKETLYYTITLDNQTTSDAHNVLVRDSMLENLPTYATYNDDMAVNGSEYSGNLSGSNLTIFDVAAGETVTVTYSITLSDDLLDQGVDYVTNVATDNGEDPDGLCDSTTSTDDCDGVEIEVQPEIVEPIDPEQAKTVITKDVTEEYADNYASPNETLYYTVTLENNTTSDAHNVEVRDSMLENLPEYITYNDDMAVNGSEYSGDLTTSDLAVFEVPAGETVTVTYSITLSDDLLDQGVDYVTNVATDNGEDPDGLCDSSTSTEDCDGVEIEVQPEIVRPIDPSQGSTVITKEVEEEVADQLASPEETLYYTITLENTTSAAAHNVAVRDSMLENLPEYITYNDDMTVNGSEYSGDLTTSDLRVFTVASGETITITYSVTLSDGLFNEDIEFITNVATDNGQDPSGACDSTTSTEDCDGVELDVETPVDEDSEVDSEVVNAEEDTDASLSNTGQKILMIIGGLFTILVIAILIKRNLRD